jgi:hypothetical protein
MPTKKMMSTLAGVYENPASFASSIKFSRRNLPYLKKNQATPNSPQG